jgi:3-oxoacyl-[acyl-carrier-protein] synthase II
VQSVAKRRVARTGIGIVSPIGISRDGLWQGLQSGRSAVRTVSRFDPAMFAVRTPAEIDDFHPTDFLEQKRAGDSSDSALCGCVSASRSTTAESISRARTASAWDRSWERLGGVAYAESQMHVFIEKGLRALDPALALMVFGGAASCNIAIEFGSRDRIAPTR